MELRLSGGSVAGWKDMRGEGRMGRDIKGSEFGPCSAAGSGEPFIALSQQSDQMCGLETSLCQKNEG